MDNTYLGKKCPYCNGIIDESEDVVVCSICDMPHHLSCWQENKGCTTFGCTGFIKNMFKAVPLTNKEPEIIQKPNITENTKPINNNQPQYQYVNNVQPQNNYAQNSYINKSPSVNQRPQNTVPMNQTQNSNGPVNNQRFVVVKEIKQNTIQTNMPILVDKTTLILDTLDNVLYARTSFKCLTDKKIDAILVDVECSNVWEEKVEGISNFEIIDLSTRRNDIFGLDKRIPLKDASTRNVKLIINKIQFADKTVVEKEKNYKLEKVEDLLPLEQYFNSREAAFEYQRENSNKALYLPIKMSSNWICACGNINNNDEDNCFICGLNKEQIFSNLDANTLLTNLNNFREECRLKIEKERAEEAERIRKAEEIAQREREELLKKQQEEEERKREEQRQIELAKKKKRKKVFKIIIGIILAIFLTYATIFHIVPFVRYKVACSNLENQNFDKALAIFEDLEDFSDSEDKCLETIYKKAQYLEENKEYALAADEYEKVPNYLDSNKKAEECRNEDAYLRAKDLADAKDYKGAADLYETIIEYKDSKDLRNECLYQYGIICYNDANYEEAYNAFFKINSYKDVSENYFHESAYQYGLILKDRKDWSNAKRIFASLGKYKDSQTQAKVVTYEYGCELLTNGKYTEAVNVFTGIKGYKDTNSKINEAKYKYVSAHKIKSDMTTYAYLSSLKSIGYKDSAKIYNSLYAWSAKLYFNTSPTSSSSKSSISKYSSVYCHIKLSGGPPNGSTTLKRRIVYPDGSVYTGNFNNYKYYSGEDTYFYWDDGIYTNPYYGSTGYLSVTIYDGSGNAIGSGSVYISY